MFKKLKKSFSKFSPLTIVLFVVLLIFCVLLFGLLGWAMLTSLMDINDFDAKPYGFPKHIVNNFSYVLDKFEMKKASGGYASVADMFTYGFLYAFGSAFCNTATLCVTAYVCARFRFKYTKVIYTTVIVVMMIPIVGNLPSEIQMAQTFRLYNKIWGLWIMKSNFLGIYFLVFYSTYKSFPDAYSEAAKIDGAGNLRILLQIMLPLTATLFSTVLLINFINYWNDFQVPLVYLRDYPTIAVGVNRLTISSDNGMDTIPRRMAVTMIMLLPIIVVFSVFSKKLLGNLTVGGVKG